MREAIILAHSKMQVDICIFNRSRVDEKNLRSKVQIPPETPSLNE